MPITPSTSQYFYIDSPSFNTATSVFLDPGLTVCAPDGMYSNGLISRQLVGCVLLPKQTCPQCSPICDFTISSPSDLGVYNMDIDMGSSASSVGAIVIRFNPYYTPDGIMAEFDGAFYNKLYSATYGLLESAIPNTPTFIGVGTGACTILIAGGTDNFDLFNYDGTSFINSTTESVTVDPDQLASTVATPGECVLVIPKPTPTPSLLNVRIYSLCQTVEWDITVPCPEVLTPISRSDNQDSFEFFDCNAPLDLTFYRVPITLPATSILQIGDLVFDDEYGGTPLPDGSYLVNPSILPPTNDTMEVQNGFIKGFSFTCAA